MGESVIKTLIKNGLSELYDLSYGHELEIEFSIGSQDSTHNNQYEPVVPLNIFKFFGTSQTIRKIIECESDPTVTIDKVEYVYNSSDVKYPSRIYNIRKYDPITKTETIQKLKKTKIRSVRIGHGEDHYRESLKFSTEEVSNYKDDKVLDSKIRKRVTLTGKKWKIDMSMYYPKGTSRESILNNSVEPESYNVEFEFIGASKSLFTVDVYVIEIYNMANLILSIVNDLRNCDVYYVYSIIAKRFKSIDFFKPTFRAFLVQPRAVTFDMIETIRTSGYVVSPKADGITVLIACVKDISGIKTYIISHANAKYENPIEGDILGIGDNILFGELVSNGNILLFDSYIKNTPSADYITRHGYCAGLTKSLKNVKTKPIYRVASFNYVSMNVNHIPIVTDINSILEINVPEIEQDGLIFTPINTSVPLKFKNPWRQSADFKVIIENVKDNNNDSHFYGYLYVVNHEKSKFDKLPQKVKDQFIIDGKLTPRMYHEGLMLYVTGKTFEIDVLTGGQILTHIIDLGNVGTIETGIKFDCVREFVRLMWSGVGTIKPNDYYVLPSMSELVIQDGMVIECIMLAGKWFPIGTRPDKKKPNAYYVVEDVLKITLNPVNFTNRMPSIREPVRDTSSDDYRSTYYGTETKKKSPRVKDFANFIKYNLFSDVKINTVFFKKKVLNGAFVLDLACGPGNDMSKFKNLGFTNMVMIDSDSKSVQEIIRRKSNPEFNGSQISAMHADLNDPSVIQKILIQAKAFKMTVGFDLISCMNAIHYLDINIIHEIVNGFLAQTGSFIFVTFNGKKVHELLKQNNGVYMMESDGIWYKIEANYKLDSEFSENLTITFSSSTINSRPERLVDLEKIIEKFSEYDIMKIGSYGDMYNKYSESKNKAGRQQRMLSSPEKEFMFLYWFVVLKKKPPK